VGNWDWRKQIFGRSQTEASTGARAGESPTRQPSDSRAAAIGRQTGNATAGRQRTGGLWAAAAIGLLLTIGGWTLSAVTVSVIPQGEGPSATALVGGGEAEESGVTLQIGNYTVVSGPPYYVGDSVSKIQAICKKASNIVAGKATEDTVPLSIEPIGITKCLANGQGFETDGGRFTVNLEAVGAIQAKYTAAGVINNLALSKISAQVNQSAIERSSEIAALVLIAAGPGLVIGALIPLLQGGKRESS
jgi:hypothetical protein